MCNEILVELCAREFEHLVDAMFEKARASGDKLFHVPIIGRLCAVQNEDYIAKLKQLTRAALAARKHFRQHGPPWAPHLPLTFAEIERMECDESNRIELVGHFAGSLMMLGWDYQTHPSFHDYVGGVLAYEHTPNRRACGGRTSST